MKYLVMAAIVALAFTFGGIAAELKPTVPPPNKSPIPNPAIDFDGYMKVAAQSAEHRQTRRLTEEDFIKMSAEKDTIILDARSKEKFDLLHIKGAINLNFSDINVDSLKEMIPNKDTKILIYCNNNFEDTPIPARFRQQQGPNGQPNAVLPRPFMTKMKTASLNISTYIALYNYGYRNVYELGPQLNVEKVKIAFESKTR